MQGQAEPSGQSYLGEVTAIIDHLHKNFLNLLKLELNALGVYDVNNVQGMMVFHIGDAEMTVGELSLRGYYRGTNLTHNVKKIVRNGYVVYKRSDQDRRIFYIKLTDKGRALRDQLADMHRRHIEMLAQTPVTDEDLQKVTVTLHRFEQFWVHAANRAPRVI